MVELERISDYLIRIPRSGRMNVEGRIYADERLMETQKSEEAIKQVQNVACLPGIVKYSLAMPDFHWGYGFPIGGVAAFDLEEGVVSPGGVGFDINCGVRLVRTNLTKDQIKTKIEDIATKLFKSIPTGVGSEGGIKKLNKDDFKKVSSLGVRWAIDNGFAKEEDLDYIEEKGCLEGADLDTVSDDAINRGRGQLGSLGSGNHFLEVQVIDEIYDEKTADILGLKKNGITFSIHCGSRGFGHQICDDYLKIMIKAADRYSIYLPDKQLCCAPLKSLEARNYLASMKCAANFAWCNRQIISYLSNKALCAVLNISEEELGSKIVYDVCHNIAKIEEHQVDGKKVKLCIHRKGATRALPPNHELTPVAYKSVGQPVMIPGDMGRKSYVLIGTATASKETFCSSAHGAGRVRSRNQMIKIHKGKNLYQILREEYGVIVKAHGFSSVAEEMPDAYKDADIVAGITEKAGISRRVARLKPLCCVKG